VQKIVEAASAKVAAGIRADMAEALAEEAAPDRTHVSDYAKSWIESKGPCVDKGTSDRYEEALELHVLPALGGFYYDALKPADGQAWINKALRTNASNGKLYAVDTVRSWFRVFRTMTRDAIVQLEPSLDVRLLDGSAP
jgi:integrase-like protein